MTKEQAQKLLQPALDTLNPEFGPHEVEVIETSCGSSLIVWDHCGDLFFAIRAGSQLRLAIGEDYVLRLVTLRAICDAMAEMEALKL